MANKDVLTEEELGALMDTVSSDSADEQNDDGEYQRYDFLRRQKSLLTEIPVLKMINDKQVLELNQGFHSEFNLSADISITESRILKLDEFMKLLPLNAGINLFRLSPLNGTSALVIPGSLMSLLVDVNFGGKLKESYEESEERVLTSSERRSNERILSRFFSSIVDGWSDVLVLEPQSQGFETNPEFAYIGVPDSLGVLVTFQFDIGEQQFPVYWLLPYAALESVRQRLISAEALAAPEAEGQTVDWGARIGQELLTVDTELQAKMTTFELPLGEVIKLGEGSIVPITMPSKVVLCIEDLPMVEAQYGASNGKKSVKIMSD